MKENRKDLPENVPYLAYEDAIAMSERHIKRLIIIIGLLIVLLAASNFAWLHAWTQYDYCGEEVTTTQDGKGVNINTVGGGDIDYGAENNLQKTRQDAKESQ